MAEPLEAEVKAADIPETPPPDDPYTPVDHHVNLDEPEPPPPEPPVKPEPHRHSTHTLRMARDLGLQFTQAQLDATPPEQLADYVYEQNRVAVQRVRETALQEAWQRNQQAAQPKPPEAVPPELDENTFAPELVQAFRTQRERASQQEKQLQQIQQHLAQTTHLLQQQTLQQQHAHLQAQQQALYAIYDSTFAERPDLMGKGEAAKLTPGSPEMQRRLATLAAVQSDPAPGTVADKIRLAMETLFGEKMAPPPTPEVQAKLERWNGAALARPSQRKAPEEPMGHKRATLAVHKQLKAKGYDPGVVNADEDTIP